MEKNKNIWDKKYDNMKTEKRFFDVETRVSKPSEGEEGTTTIVGHAAVFNARSEEMWGFQEVIAPGAFDGVLGDDTRCYFNHNDDLILGRTTSGTLRLSIDERGLKYELDVPDTTYARDLVVSMERGDVTQSSFSFQVEEDKWEIKDGIDLRTIVKVKRLYDVSPVSLPAYPSASAGVVAQRSLAKHKEGLKKEEEEKDLVSRSMLDLELEIRKRKYS